MQALDILYIAIGIAGVFGVIYTVASSRLGVTKSTTVGDINLRRELETFTLIYEVKHPPIQSILAYRLFHWLFPITISIGGPGSRAWGTVRVYCLDATQDAIKEVERFVDHHDSQGRTIKFPRLFELEPHIRYISIEVTRHYPRKLVEELVLVKRSKVSEAPLERWRYDLQNTTRRDIREFEIEINELPPNFSTFTIVQTSPDIDTRESDVVVHDEILASRVGATGQRISRKVIWHLPLLKQDVEGRLEFEFS